jgi:hypothetical protein
MFAVLMQQEELSIGPGDPEKHERLFAQHEECLADCERYCQDLDLEVGSQHATDLVRMAKQRQLKRHDV